MKPNLAFVSSASSCWCWLGTHPVWAQQDPAGAEGPGSTYSSLRPQQKRLVDDWFTRLSAVVKKPVDPAEGYENLPLSTRTTFNAVTHALLMTRLTDASGESLSDSAIELVDKSRRGRRPDSGLERRPAVQDLRPDETRCVGAAQPEQGVLPLRRQHRLSQGLPDLLPQHGRYTVDPVLSHARRVQSRHRCGLPLLQVSGGAVEWTPDGVQFRHSRQWQRCEAQPAMVGHAELVAKPAGPAVGGDASTGHGVGPRHPSGTST